MFPRKEEATAMQDGFATGRMLILPPLSNGHKIQNLYMDRQLNEDIYPAMIRALTEGGFDSFEGDGDWWKLLNTVAIGGTIYLNGPKYPNPRSYQPDTIRNVFMSAERNLVHALMTTVFCKEVPYGCSPISFKEVNGSFKFDTRTAFRQAILVLKAENESSKDLYRITIKGFGEDLSKHQFIFEPSLTWVCSRFPDRLQVTTRNGEVLSESSIDSQVPPQQVVVVSGISDATCSDGMPLVRDLKWMSEFVSNSGDFYRYVVQTPTSEISGSLKSAKKLRASARLAAKARP
jgi:hypothetical protein